MKKLHSQNSRTSQMQTVSNSLLSQCLLILLSVGLVGSALANPDEGLPYYDSMEFTPKWIAADSPELEGFHAIPDFKFIDQDGQTVSQDSLRDKIYVANFFFTSCPGICIRIRSKLSMVQDAYLDDPEVAILSHSIRPSSDTVEVLKEYAVRNNVQSNKWHLLTGNKELTYSLAKSAYFANEDLGELKEAKDLLDFLHSENLLLIDKNRRIRGIYNGLRASSVSYLIDDIKILKAEHNASP